MLKPSSLSLKIIFPLTFFCFVLASRFFINTSLDHTVWLPLATLCSSHVIGWLMLTKLNYLKFDNTYESFDWMKCFTQFWENNDGFNLQKNDVLTFNSVRLDQGSKYNQFNLILMLMLSCTAYKRGFSLMSSMKIMNCIF